MGTITSGTWQVWVRAEGYVGRCRQYNQDFKITLDYTENSKPTEDT